MLKLLFKNDEKSISATNNHYNETKSLLIQLFTNILQDNYEKDNSLTFCNFSKSNSYNIHYLVQKRSLPEFKEVQQKKFIFKSSWRITCYTTNKTTGI